MQWTRSDGASLFDGLAPDEVSDALDGLERQVFPAGSIVFARGDNTRHTYLVESGAADVLVPDRHGVEQRLSRVSRGATLGEMSFLTGEPAAGTVRAATDLVLVVLSEAELDRMSRRHPRIYRNLSAILAQRLARATRRAIAGRRSGLTVLLARQPPPLLGYALASSIAWHSRSPTLLLVLGEEPDEDLAAIAARRPGEAILGGPAADGDGSRAADIGARVLLAPRRDAFSDEALPATVEDLFRSYAHVLIEAADPLPPLETARVLTLVAADSRSVAPGPRSAYTIRGSTAAANGIRPDRGGVLSVPRPTDADVEALRAGLLPSDSDCGRALGWAARDLAGLEVGLALGAGSLKGYTHVGVLASLARHNVPIDYLAGTSIGSAVAALHALGHRPDQVAAILDSFGPTIFRFALPSKGFVSSVGLRKTLRLLGEETRIEDLQLPLALVAVDLDSQREVVFRRGLLWLAVLASTAIPGMYPAQRVGDYTLVDGGVLNPVPSNVAAEMGADKVIAIKLAGDAAPPHADAEAVESEGTIPSVFGVVRRSIEIMEGKISTDSARAATLIISPPLHNVPGSTVLRLRRFTEGRRYIEAGEAATEAALPRLASALPWVRA